MQQLQVKDVSETMLQQLCTDIGIEMNISYLMILSAGYDKVTFSYLAHT